MNAGVQQSRMHCTGRMDDHDYVHNYVHDNVP